MWRKLIQRSKAAFITAVLVAVSLLAGHVTSTT